MCVNVIGKSFCGHLRSADEFNAKFIENRYERHCLTILILS